VALINDKGGVKWFINRIDDPFDNFKHWWHGRKWKVFGRCYQTWAYMSNHPHTRWKIERIECDENNVS
jgi:hypothetical protein